MSDFSRSSFEDPNELETLLLRAAEDDGPEPGSLEKVSAALGVSAAALGATTAGAVAAHTAGQAATLAKPLTLLSLSKWLAVGVGAGLATGGAAHLASRTFANPPASVAATATTAPRPTNLVVPAAPRAVAPVPPVATAEPEVSAAAPVAAVPSQATPLVTASGHVDTEVPRAAAIGSVSFTAPEEKAPSVDTSTTSTLTQETRELDAARRALATGHTAEALAALDAYRAAWPTGALQAEASLLRVDALLRVKNRPAAEREANALIAAAPGSRYATRARELLAGAAK